MSHPSNISGLDDIRTTLIKRAFIERQNKTEKEIDALLAKNFGEDWKIRYGIEPQKSCSPSTAYTGKSVSKINEEFFQKEIDEALEKATKDWQKKQRAKARRAKAEAKKKEKEKK